MSKPGKLVVVAVAAALLYMGGTWIVGGDDAAPAHGEAEDPALLYNRAWIDSKPEKYVDYVNVFMFLDFAPLCIFEKASSYEVHMELCEHSRRDKKINVFFPQRDKKASFGYRIRTCDDLPPFDLCVELTSNPWGKPKKFYSMSDPDDQMRDVQNHLMSHARAFDVRGHAHPAE